MSDHAQGLLAMYESAEPLKAALRRFREAGFARLQVYSPYSDDEIDELTPGRPTRIGWVLFAAGIVGAASAYFLQWYACRDYALNVGGRPIHSWPSYIPVTFELTVLSAALAGLAALLWFCRLPRLDHPVFNDPRFLRASQDRFFLCVDADEALTDRQRTLELFGPEADVREVLS